jgi:predicted metal-dependent hydrolase
MKKTVLNSSELGLAFDAPVELIRRKRQKYLRIRVKAEAIQVSAPHRVRLADMKAFVREKNEWVVQEWQKLQQRDQQFRRALDQRKDQFLWKGNWLPIRYQNVASEHAEVAVLRRKEDHIEFVYSGEQNLTPEIRKAFYRKQAKRYLPDRVKAIAELHDFQVNRIYVRDQKTKWGSCSSKSNISLNWRLMSCPDPVIDYLIIHECCHLVHMNHSKRFWNLVERLCPRYNEHEDWLREHEAMLFRLP